MIFLSAIAALLMLWVLESGLTDSTTMLIIAFTVLGFIVQYKRREE